MGYDIDKELERMKYSSTKAQVWDEGMSYADGDGWSNFVTGDQDDWRSQIDAIKAKLTEFYKTKETLAKNRVIAQATYDKYNAMNPCGVCQDAKADKQAGKVKWSGLITALDSSIATNNSLILDYEGKLAVANKGLADRTDEDIAEVERVAAAKNLKIKTDAEAVARASLATKGTTPEAVLKASQGVADALLRKTEADKQVQLLSAKTSSNTKYIVVGSSILIVMVLGVILLNKKD
jgi:hypothetical protein